MKIVKFLTYWLIKIFESLFFAIVYHQKNKNITKKILIFGNGPSLNETISFILKNNIRPKFDLLCVNDFAATNYFYELKPSLYLLMDNGYFSADLKNNTKEEY